MNKFNFKSLLQAQEFLIKLDFIPQLIQVKFNSFMVTISFNMKYSTSNMTEVITFLTRLCQLSEFKKGFIYYGNSEIKNNFKSNSDNVIYDIKKEK